MRKRKYLVYFGRRSKLVISYIDKKYKIYDFNDNDNLEFYPEGVKIELTDNPSYFTRFGRLYKRCAINRQNTTEYRHKKYTKRIFFPINQYQDIEFFDDLNAAKLWLELQEKQYNNSSDECCCESAG